MTDASSRIRDLDLSIFDHILTETSNEDRRALLGVQRAVMLKYGQFAYLEIGSHLGGSIQPYLLKPACTHIYSIDSRPLLQPDDRSKDYFAHYPDNSTLRMLEYLRSLDPDAVDKIKCFETDARHLKVTDIGIRPMIAFIDGEHTRSAVNLDFDFCMKVIVSSGVIIFHDFRIIYKAIFDALHKLRRKDCVGYLIDGDVFGIFLNPNLAFEDEYLHARYKENRHYHRWFAAKRAVSRFTPKSVGWI
jgi:hypothetical protein